MVSDKKDINNYLRKLTDEDRSPFIVLSCFAFDTPIEFSLEESEAFSVEADEPETFIDQNKILSKQEKKTASIL